MFDLPVTEADERKAATAFRNFLLEQGFEMAQYSVYLRYCLGKDQTKTFLKRVEHALPKGGKVEVLRFTDKQYENIVSFHNRRRQARNENPTQFRLL